MLGGRVPRANRAHRVRHLDIDLPATGGLYGSAPPGWHESGNQVGQRGEHEEALGGRRVGHDEQLLGRPRVGFRVDRAGVRWAFDRKARTPEDEQIEVELARTPARPTATPERTLELLELRKQRHGSGGGVGAGWDVQGDDRIAEHGLVDDPHGFGRVQPRDATEAHAQQTGERPDRRCQGGAGIADVRPQPDVGADATVGHGSLIQTRLDSKRMVIRPVTVRILHPEPGPAAGPIECWVAAERAKLAEWHRVAFVQAGAADAAIVGGPPDDTPFGARLRDIVRADRPEGLVVLGSGAIPMASARDHRDLVAAAAAEGRVALANNRFSADVVAIACAEVLADLPDLPGDNALPRWLAEVAGYQVTDLRRRWRLALDVDGPLELAMIGARSAPVGVDLARVRARIAAIRSIAADRRAELVVTGRTSAATVAWLERGVRSRVRAIIEERGLRAASPLAQAPAPATAPGRRDSASDRSRAPISLLGALLDRDGPAALGDLLTRLGDAAIVDTRVLLAHRLGADEAGWPEPEERFASDLLLPGSIRDPWLHELTAAAVDARIPILLGGHSLVGPGIRLLLGRTRFPVPPWT